jgi:hypothetical protein
MSLFLALEMSMFLLTLFKGHYLSKLLSLLSLRQPLWDSCFPDQKNPFVLRFCVFNKRGTTRHIFCFYHVFYFECLLFQFTIPCFSSFPLELISNPIWRFESPNSIKVMNMPIDNVKLSFIV